MRSAEVLRSLAAIAALVGCGSHERAPERIAVVAREPCASCHASEADEWRGSLHHGAFDDRDFQASFALEPADFCFRCHAPEAKGRTDHVGASRGVGCLSCHVVAAAAPATRHMTTRSCDGCHEFTFPASEVLMQSTTSEHAASSFADVACATCHAPRVNGRRDHRFDVTRNLPLLRDAVAVVAERTPEGIAIRLTTRNVGHAMPTGDLFRRLRIVVTAEDATGRLLGDDEAVLGRRFDRSRSTPELVRDDRIVGARTVRLEGAWLVRAAKIAIDVRYERVAHTDDADVAPRPSERHEALFASESLATIELEERTP